MDLQSLELHEDDDNWIYRTKGNILKETLATT